MTDNNDSELTKDDVVDMSAEETPESQTAPPCGFAGFWRRLGAFVIDMAVLGAAGILLGLLFEDFFISLGQWGRLIGLAIALPYFALLDGRHGGGRTLGKRLLGIRVVDATGVPLSTQKAAGRYLLIAPIWLLNGISLPGGFQNPLLVALLAFVVFGAGLVLIYLMLFNRPTRQSFHDLAVGSFVVRGAEGFHAEKEEVKRIHLVACGLLVAGVLALPWVLKGLFPGDMQKLFTAVEEAVSKVPEARLMQISFTVGKSPQKVLTLVVSVPRRALLTEVKAAEIARPVVQGVPQVATYDRVAVTLLNGFDIGIAHITRSKTVVESPLDWERAR